MSFRLIGGILLASTFVVCLWSYASDEATPQTKPVASRVLQQSQPLFFSRPVLASAYVDQRVDEHIEEELNGRDETPRPTAVIKKVKGSDLKIPAYVKKRIELEQVSSNEGKDISYEPDDKKNEIAKSALPISKRSPQSIQTGSSKNGSEHFSIRAIEFLPGLTAVDEPIMQPVNMATVLRKMSGAPDYSLATKEPPTERILSLGNGGVIILEVVDGWIVDGPGPDFVIFENPFVFQGPDGVEVFAETAVVSVAEENQPQSYRMFPCNSSNPPYTGCAGVMPVRYSPNVALENVGGDVFDLADLQLNRIRYIRIEDTGDNVSFAEGTEGFDLDAAGVFHPSPFQ